MSDVYDAATEIAKQIRNNVPGIRSVPDEPPENVELFPFVVVYPLTGTYGGHTPEDMLGLHNINVELHVKRDEKRLAQAYRQLAELQDDIPRELLEGIRDSDYSHLQTFGDITYTFGPANWAGVETLAVVYTINEVKVTTNL